MANIFDDNYEGFLWWALGQFMEGKTAHNYFRNAFIAARDRVPTDQIVRSIAIKSALFILYYALNKLGT